jgi:L-aminopeptidase/D-esterase-like protein
MLGVIATDAEMTTEQANLVAMMAYSGIARRVSPAPTLYDGDTLFVLATGRVPRGNLTLLGHTAAQVVDAAIVNAVKHATTLGGVRAWNE